MRKHRPCVVVPFFRANSAGCAGGRSLRSGLVLGHHLFLVSRFGGEVGEAIDANGAGVVADGQQGTVRGEG